VKWLQERRIDGKPVHEKQEVFHEITPELQAFVPTKLDKCFQNIHISSRQALQGVVQEICDRGLDAKRTGDDTGFERAICDFLQIPLRLLKIPVKGQGGSLEDSRAVQKDLRKRLIEFAGGKTDPGSGTAEEMPQGAANRAQEQALDLLEGGNSMSRVDKKANKLASMGRFGKAMDTLMRAKEEEKGKSHRYDRNEVLNCLASKFPRSTIEWVTTLADSAFRHAEVQQVDQYDAELG
jgi:hypothetical protein